ncbi:MAG TPA: hypothetical protein VKE40_16360, partial [Gemmataceae bacterium]|nr:hypothetical protein [Gemmataceae bacterium]
ASKPIRQPDPPVALEVTADLDKSTDDWTIRAAEVAQHLDKLEGSFEKNAAGVEWDRDRSGPLGGGRFMVRVVPRIQVGAKGRLAWAADWIKVIPWVRETRIVPQDGGGGGTVLSQAVMGASSFDLSFPGSARERTGLCGSAARDGS